MTARPRVEIGIDCRDPVELAPFWEAALGYVRTAGDGHPYLNLESPDDDGPVVFLQRVPESKAAKNRLHLDLYTRAPELLVERLVGLGASVLGEPVGPPELWSYQVLADPEGNEFCVCREVGDDVS
jgi:predicted enzyme related to lactoylglutathione lyase